MRTSQQAGGNRHLAPVSAPCVWRAVVWREDRLGYEMAYVFDMACEKDAEMFALDATTEPWEPGVTAMYYVIGEVAS